MTAVVLRDIYVGAKSSGLHFIVIGEQHTPPPVSNSIVTRIRIDSYGVEISYCTDGLLLAILWFIYVGKHHKYACETSVLLFQL